MSEWLKQFMRYLGFGFGAGLAAMLVAVVAHYFGCEVFP